jgi:hypothetical protein
MRHVSFHHVSLPVFFLCSPFPLSSCRGASDIRSSMGVDMKWTSLHYSSYEMNFPSLFFGVMIIMQAPSIHCCTL